MQQMYGFRKSEFSTEILSILGCYKVRAAAHTLRVKRSSEVAALLEEFYIRPLPREGEPTVWKTEEVLTLVVDKVRDALLAQRHLKLVEAISSPSPALPVAPEPTHPP